MSKYYVDSDGNYLGSFDGYEPNEDSIEFENPPEHAWQKWDGERWLPLTQEQLDLLNGVPE